MHMDTMNKRNEKTKRDLFLERVGFYLNWIAVVALLLMFAIIKNI
jgi:hypothetical protein